MSQSSDKKARAKGGLAMQLPITFGLVGLVAATAMIHFGVDSFRFQQRAVSVPGQVVRLVGRDNDVKSAVVEYVDARGDPRRVESSWSARPAAFHVGERVRVLHEPHDPSSARIDCFGDLWGKSAFAAIFAITFGGVTIWMLLAYRRR